MKLEPMYVDSLESAINKLPEISEAFEKNGVVSMRGYRFSDDDHGKIVQLLGDKYGWNVCSDAEYHVLESARYPGGHSDDPNMVVGTKDNYKLDWHIEQVFYIDPILAGAWNMTKFTADSSTGNTRFADSTKIYKSLTTEEQEFLNKSVVFWDKPLNTGEGPFYTKAVDFHPYDKEPVIRVETDWGCTIMPELYLFDKESPSQEQKDKFLSIMKKVKDTLNNNEDIRLTQHWEEGDLLIVDLFRMYHAVMGGFKYGERVFTGMGIRPKVYNNDLYKDVELLWKN